VAAGRSELQGAVGEKRCRTVLLAILSVAITVVFATAVMVFLRFPGLRLEGSQPSHTLVFSAILFTSGLDVGLIMFPLTEFPRYESEPVYAFANPLAIEFGFWGFLVWAFYFLSTFYFCLVEPRLRLFEIPWLRIANSLVIVTTCAFTGFLFLDFLPSYLPELSLTGRYVLVSVVVVIAVVSSSELSYIRWLGLGSSVLFLLLILLLWSQSGAGFDGLFANVSMLGEYFRHLPKFVYPLSEHHGFYLYWWFAWSIMIGQFVARFVGGIRAWQLLLALLVLPSIPIALWFSVLYFYYDSGVKLDTKLQSAMVLVGLIFVVNSLDSLTRLYSENLNLTVERLGRSGYILVHWLCLSGLILLYRFTPLKIEWIGLSVMVIYAIVFLLTYRHREQLRASGQ
ncbi:MAG: BCCT family transporter, partial [Pseudomonadota bacterium]